MIIPILAKKEKVEARLNECKSCENKTNFNLVPFCKKCGCMISAKVRLENQKCPIGKW